MRKSQRDLRELAKKSAEAAEHQGTVNWLMQMAARERAMRVERAREAIFLKPKETLRGILLGTSALYQATFTFPYRPFLGVGAQRREPVAEAA